MFLRNAHSDRDLGKETPALKESYALFRSGPTGVEAGVRAAFVFPTCSSVQYREGRLRHSRTSPLRK